MYLHDPHVCKGQLASGVWPLSCSNKEGQEQEMEEMAGGVKREPVESQLVHIGD